MENEKAKKEQPNLFVAISNSLKRYKFRWACVFMVLAIVVAANIFENIEERYNVRLAKIEQAQQDMIDAKVAAKAKYEMEKNENARIAKAQVVSIKNDKFTTIYNAYEDKFPFQYRLRLAEWAKEQGYDGIVFGRLQPLFDGGVKFATYSGKNEVPVDYVVEKLRLNGCKNVISVMSNRDKFWLPYPFTYQVDGDLKVYESNGISAAGFFSITDDKIKLVSDNFDGTMKGDKFSAKLSDNKPWEFTAPNEIKKH